MEYHFQPIGRVHSPYREKFAIPRQPGLVTVAESFIELSGPCNREEILRELHSFSHIWIVFIFHEALREQWKPMVRPPRLGGNNKVGVFASRSPFRPNPIGLSAVTLDRIEQHRGVWRVYFQGGDLLHGTPVLDIKPYIPYTDALPQANGAYANEPPPNTLCVTFSPSAQQQLAQLSAHYPQLQTLIEQVLQQRPQPAYHGEDTREYGMQLYDLNIRWQAQANTQQVVSILHQPLDTP